MNPEAAAHTREPRVGGEGMGRDSTGSLNQLSSEENSWNKFEHPENGAKQDEVRLDPAACVSHRFLGPVFDVLSTAARRVQVRMVAAASRAGRPEQAFLRARR